MLTLVLNLSVLLPLQNDQYSNNLALCLTNSCSSLHPFTWLSSDSYLDWVVLGIWWFIFQQKRPGPKIPKGSNYATIGFKQIWLAIREVRALPQTFIYFVAYFLLADGLNTTGKITDLSLQCKFTQAVYQEHSSASFKMITYPSHFCSSPISGSRKLSARLPQPSVSGISRNTSSLEPKLCSW
jgi:hypothetical protein